MSDVHPGSMIPGQMVFLRFTYDRRGIAPIGGSGQMVNNRELHHMFFRQRS